MTATIASDPKFIKYLFDPARKYDCHLLVGNPKISTPEKIGVVKDMLFAHSSVMRTDLQVSNLQEKTPVEILDIFPHTFRNLLRYVYGHDNTDTLSFDDADNLLYAAEKYIITELKDKLATRLMLMLNCENICSLMNNPVVYEALELNAKITKILRTETQRIFAQPSFLELTADAFVKILEQDSLNVREIEVWRNAIKWAKHKAKSDKGEKLRAKLKKPLKHIRLCSLSEKEFCREVVPTKVLHSDEIESVCVSIGTKQKRPELTEICNEVVVRSGSCTKSPVLHKVWSLDNYCCATTESVFTIMTKDSAIEMASLTLDGEYHGQNNGLTFNFTTDVEQVGNPETKTRVTFNVHNLYGDVTIPISTQDQEVLLLSNTEYRVTISCDQYFYACSSISSQTSDEHFTLMYQPNRYNNLWQCIKRLDYKTVQL